MLNYNGNDNYTFFADNGKEIVLSEQEIKQLFTEARRENVIECAENHTDEDYEMITSENKFLAQYLKEKVGLSDEQISTLANTGFIK